MPNRINFLNSLPMSLNQKHTKWKNNKVQSPTNETPKDEIKTKSITQKIKIKRTRVKTKIKNKLEGIKKKIEGLNWKEKTYTKEKRN
jgi:hypothetical protein